MSINNAINNTAANIIQGYTATATAASTTTLTVASTFQQFFTGSTTQTVALPVTSTLVLGQAYYIVNNSSGAVTVQSSGGNTVLVMAANTWAMFTCILTSGTSAASWNYAYSLSNSSLPYKNVVVSSSCGSYSSASSTFTPVTNLSVTITTLGGAVSLTLQSDNTNTGSFIQVVGANNNVMGIFRGVTQLSSEIIYGAAQTYFPCSVIFFIDTPGPGTYTYTLQIMNAAGATTQINNAVLVASEG